MPGLDSMLELIHANLQRLGFAVSLPHRDTGWIRSGYQHCRRFDFGEVQVVWFLECGQVRFYGPHRKRLRTVIVDEFRTDRTAA